MLAGAGRTGFALAVLCCWLAAPPASAETLGEAARTPGEAAVEKDGEGVIVAGHEAPDEHVEDGCAETPTTLCLQGGRYEVSAAWSTLDGDSGSAHTVRARTADSGLFYFFNPGNWEMLVKVLDGCTFNQHHWVFAASATDLGLDLTVRDTKTGDMKRYEKAPGSPAPAVADVGAFPLGCDS